MPRITGHLIDSKTQQQLPGLEITAIYRRRSDAKQLRQQMAKSGSTGAFKFPFPASLFNNLPKNDAIEVIFQVSRGNQKLKSQGGIKGLKPKDHAIKIKVDGTPTTEDAPSPKEPRTVHGMITWSNGKPAAGVIVLGFDRDLRSEQPLGETRTDTKGIYEIRYEPSQFKRAEKEGADLLLRVHDGNENLLGESRVHFNSPDDATIDLVVQMAAKSEFEQLVEDGNAVIKPEGLTWAKMQEDDKNQDITFLSKELITDPRRIAFMIVAHRFAKRTDMEPAVFYGWFRYNLPPNLPSLLLQIPDVMRRALQETVRDNIIPARFGKDDVIDEVLAALKKLKITEALRQPQEGETRPPIVSLVATVLKQRKQQEIFLGLLADHEGPGKKFWETVRLTPELADAAEPLQFTVETGALTGNHLPLVEELQRLRGANTIRRLSDLVQFDEDGWVSILKRASGAGIIGAPEGIPGEGEERIKNYARLLERSMERSFPTAFVAERLKQDDVEDKAELVAFLEAHADTFDFNGPRLKTFLANNPGALDQIPGEKREAVKKHLREFQRLYRVAPQYKATNALWDDGIRCALDIARTSRTLFGLKYGHAGALGDRATAERIHARARSAHAFTLALATDDGMHAARMAIEAETDRRLAESTGDGDMHSVTMAIESESSSASMARMPEWHSLFGSIELCECEHCRSVYSPAAYLVDILQFLNARELVDPETLSYDEEYGILDQSHLRFQRRDGRTLNAQDLLFDRRPDIGQIELTCENTNTPLPYVDLVNEILEDHIAAPAAFSPFDIDAALAATLDQFEISEELRAAFVAGDADLSPFSLVEVQKRGERWRIHDQAFSYALRLVTDASGTAVKVQTRSRQTVGSVQELAAHPQYLNPAAYTKLKEAVFPMSLPLDLWEEEMRTYLGHLGVSRHELMEAFALGRSTLRLADTAIAMAHLGLTLAETNLIVGETIADPAAASPGPWNLWGFPSPAVDAAGRIKDPHPAVERPEWIDSGENWQVVLTSRVDVFLQQADITYKQLLSLLGTYFVNPLLTHGERQFHLVARAGQPVDTCETEHLAVDGMATDGNAILRAQRFIRLWRKLGWSMRDLDRALTALGVNTPPAPGNDVVLGGVGAAPITHDVITRLSHIKRLQERLKLPLETILAFWADIDHSRYIDHDSAGQPPHRSLYERLFRNRALVNPPDPDFAEEPVGEDPAEGLHGSLHAKDSTIAAVFGLPASELAQLRTHTSVIPTAEEDTLNLSNLSRLYRHVVLAKGLRLPVADYLIAVDHVGDPFTSPLGTIQFVETVDHIGAGRLTWKEIDYLARHRFDATSRIVPSDEAISAVLGELRVKLQAIALENTFQEPSAESPIVDADGSLTRRKLALLGWDSSLIDDLIAALQSDARDEGLVRTLREDPVRLIQRNMRSFAIERFDTHLAGTSTFDIPHQFTNKLYYERATETLFFVGAMREGERDDLLALPDSEADSDFKDAIGILYDAADTPMSSGAFLTAADFAAYPATLPDTEPDRSASIQTRFAVVLRKLLPHLRAALSEQAVLSALSEHTGLDVPTVRRLLSEWLSMGSGPLLDAFLDPGFVESHPDLPVTRDAWPIQFDGVLLLSKIALVLQRFDCTERQAAWLFNFATAAHWPDLRVLPLASTDIPSPPIEAWGRLAELFSLRDGMRQGEDMLEELLTLANFLDAGADDSDLNSFKTEYMEALERWTGWSSSDLAELLGDPGDHSATGILGFSFPDDYRSADITGRLREVFALINRLGVSAGKCVELAGEEASEAVALSARQAGRAKHDEQEWLNIAKPLRDVLREKQRAALVAYALHHPPRETAWRQLSDLYSYFLIDVEMSPCQMTSRIKQALSSVQLFVQRCLMNLEPDVLASAEIDEDWRHWEWMKNYRVWEANLKILLYSENWLNSAWLDNKSPFFRELEGALLQDDLNHETAETAFRGYLAKLDQVARLEVVGLYHEKEYGAGGQRITNDLHVFGRTAGTPHVYFYRRRVNDQHWTAWERVDLDIEGEHLIPVVWRRRLYLIWPLFMEEAKAVNPTFALDKEIDLQPEKHWKIQLAWSEYRDSQWFPKRITSSYITSTAYDWLGTAEESQFLFKSVPTSDRLVVQPLRLVETISNDTIDPPFVIAQPAFVLEGCNNDFAVDNTPLDLLGWPFISHLGMFVTVVDNLVPIGLLPHATILDEHDPDGQLLLPRSLSDFSTALSKTPGKQEFRIVLGSDRVDHIASLRSTSWLFNDRTRAYFVVPSYEHLVDVSSSVVTPFPGTVVIDRSEGPAERIGDPFDFSWSLWSTGRPFPFLLSGDPVLPGTLPAGGVGFGASDSARDVIPLSGDTGSDGIGAGTMGGPAITSSGPDVASATIDEILKEPALGKDLLEEASRFDFSRFATSYEYRYAFQTFYHPYVCEFIEALNRNGVDGLMQRPIQLLSDEVSETWGGRTFDDTYDPQNPVKRPYPVEDVDFDFDGPYAQYNWELFFHSVFLIADHLRLNQRFEDAFNWMRYIFDPTDTSSLPSPKRFWRTKPFYRKSSDDYLHESLPWLMRLLASGGDFERFDDLEGFDLADSELHDLYDNLLTAVKMWRENPFNPHLVARMRTTAYQKAVVMQCLDILIAWGDQLFRRDTLESINEATQLYIMAADLLGRKPERIPQRVIPEVQTYNSLKAQIADAELNWLVEIEEFVPPSGLSSDGSDGSPSLPNLSTLFFCAPNNEKLLGYWDTVADRLFKIRHCMNIEGIERKLPLFEPPIDPALLVRARAAGLDIGSILSDVSAPLPPYRFTVLAQKATELCNELKGLSAALLSALEKRDAEQLQLLRAGHETELLKLVETVRQQQVDEVKLQIEALSVSRQATVERYHHFERLLGAEDATNPPIGESLPQRTGSAFAKTRLDSGIHLLPHEIGELLSTEDAKNTEQTASDMDFIANFLHSIPAIDTKPMGVGTTFFFGYLLSSLSHSFRSEARRHSYEASKSAKLANAALREHDWMLQSNSAASEIMQIDKQILAAQIREAIAELELNNHRKQIENAEAIEASLRAKFTNRDLYAWMTGQISSVYFQAYQLAFDVAKRTERAYRYELGLQDSNFIHFGYWDSLKKGLLSGERLSHDLKRMEVAYLNENRREYEIVKHVSLVQLDPAAFLDLKRAGKCEFTLPEVIFDADFTRHYLRRIKSVSLTLPCVTGPYTGVNCTLTLLRSSVRHSNTLPDGQYRRNLEADDPRFTDSFGPVESIVTSTSQADSGLFEPNLRDERFLPFEGRGVISAWRLELPTAVHAFNYETISDVVMHIRYTARDGGAAQKAAAETEIQESLNAIATVSGEVGLGRLFSARYEFGSEWHAFLHPAESALSNRLVLKMTTDRFPFMFQGNPYRVKFSKLKVFIRKNEGSVLSGLKLVLRPGDTPLTYPDPPGNFVRLEEEGGVLVGDHEPESESDTDPGVWSLAAWLEGGDRIDPEAIENIEVLCVYSVTTSA